MKPTQLTEIKDHYSSDFLEQLYTHIRLAHAFISNAEMNMNVCDAPVDDLYERVESVFAEIDELYGILCQVTDRVRIDVDDVQPNKRDTNAAD